MNDEKRRDLWRIATKENGWRPEEIGRRLGVKAKSLETIVKRGSKRSKIAPALDAWLGENAMKLASEAMREVEVPSPLVSIGLLLVSTGQDLQSPFLETEQKIYRLIEFVAQMNKRLKADLAAVEEWEKRGN